jgi:hypothetical protein
LTGGAVAKHRYHVPWQRVQQREDRHPLAVARAAHHVVVAVGYVGRSLMLLWMSSCLGPR